MLQEELKKYDKALYGEWGRFNVIFVVKNDYYGIIDKNGNVILPCNFPNYSDAYREWQQMGFPSEPQIMTENQKQEKIYQQILVNQYNDMVNSGDIKNVSFGGNVINGAEFVTLPNGNVGIVASVITSGDEKLQVKNLDGSGAFNLKIIDSEDTAYFEICSDDNNLYVGTYNTYNAFVACYKMGDFSLQWKTQLPGSQIQSLTVTESELIAFDMGEKSIRYFDKNNGSEKVDKKNSTDRWNQILSSYDEQLLVGQSGFSFNEYLKFNNKLKVYDNKTNGYISEKDIPINIGELNGIAIDKKNKRTFLCLDNKIGIFDENGYLGMFFLPTSSVQSLNFNSEKGCLMVSMAPSAGKVEIFSPNAIETFIEASNQLNSYKSNVEKLK